MIVSAMFYGTEENVESPFTLKLGPIVITIQELFVSAVSLAIVIPPSLLVVQIFRNVNVREKQMNRQKLLKDENNLSQKTSQNANTVTDGKPVQNILDKKRTNHVSFSDIVEGHNNDENEIETYHHLDHGNNGNKGDMGVTYKEHKRTWNEDESSTEDEEEESEDESDDDEEDSEDYGSEESEVEDDSEISDSDEDDDSYDGDSDLWSDEDSDELDDSDSDDDEEGTSQPKKKGLPAGCLCVGWTIAVLSIITPAFFVILYSMSWGPEISNSWLTSYTLSFFESVLITDPIKVRCTLCSRVIHTYSVFFISNSCMKSWTFRGPFQCFN